MLRLADCYGNRLLYRQTCESLWESCLGIFGVVTTATSQKKYARAIYSSIMARSVFDLDLVFYNPSDKLLHVLHKELNRVGESGRKRSNINVMYVLYSEGLVPCYAVCIEEFFAGGFLKEGHGAVGLFVLLYPAYSPNEIEGRH